MDRPGDSVTAARDVLRAVRSLRMSYIPTKFVHIMPSTIAIYSHVNFHSVKPHYNLISNQTEIYEY